MSANQSSISSLVQISQRIGCAAAVAFMVLANLGCSEVESTQSVATIQKTQEQAQTQKPETPVLETQQAQTQQAQTQQAQTQQAQTQQAQTQQAQTQQAQTQQTGTQESENKPAPQQPQLTDAERTKVLFDKASTAGVKFLLEKGQAEDGSFSKQYGPAITALCTHALLEHRVPLTDVKVKKGLKFLEDHIRKDGGIYATKSVLRNYETSVALMCFKRANQNGQYDQTIEKAVGFLQGIQWDQGEGHAMESSHFGGQGYGKHKRPDASNTSFFQDAMKAAGVDPESEHSSAAAIFMARCQNLPGKHNTAEWAQKVSKEDWGGYIYTGVGKGESKAGETPEGGLRSYASMTYAGLKSMLYAGVKQDDIRIKAAMDWIGRHYDLKTNPGMGQQGLFYYYHVFAKTLSVSGNDFIVDADGKSHDWRADLIQQLNSVQAKDGSWTNPADRWYEGDPNLVTAYSLLALSYCQKNTEPENSKTDQGQ